MIMKTKIYALMVMMVTASVSYAQTSVNKVIPFKSGQKISMRFDYPELVKVSTWDKNEISIQGSVSINMGENDDAFELLTSTTDNTISIENEIRNMKNLPHRITVRDGTKKIVFRTKEEMKKYKDENSIASFGSVSYGLEMDIILEIKVPRNVETVVESVYGMVEVKDFTGPLTVVATYGGVDAALAERSVGQITAETNYGEIFSNLDVKFGGEGLRQGDFHTNVTAKPGTGPAYYFDSKYGNVYLRKAN
jgi:hypothetical protein